MSEIIKVDEETGAPHYSQDEWDLIQTVRNAEAGDTIVVPEGLMPIFNWVRDSGEAKYKNFDVQKEGEDEITTSRGRVPLDQIYSGPYVAGLDF